MEQNHNGIAGSIRALAKSKGVTIKKMLEDCGINRNFLYDMEHSDASPSVDKLTRIAAYFDVPAATLLGDAAGEAEAFLALFHRLSPADRQALRDYMTKLLSES